MSEKEETPESGERIEDVPISFRDVKFADPDVWADLFPELPEGYIERNGIGLEKPKPKIPKSRPYVKIKNLNNNGMNPEDPHPTLAVEVGWSWDF